MKLQNGLRKLNRLNNTTMMEQNTIEIIENLDISQSQKTLLIEAIEWEKELSWSEGYEMACEQQTAVENHKKN